MTYFRSISRVLVFILGTFSIYGQKDFEKGIAVKSNGEEINCYIK